MEIAHLRVMLKQCPLLPDYAVRSSELFSLQQNLKRGRSALSEHESTKTAPYSLIFSVVFFRRKSGLERIYVE